MRRVVHNSEIRHRELRATDTCGHAVESGAIHFSHPKAAPKIRESEGETACTTIRGKDKKSRHTHETPSSWVRAGIGGGSFANCLISFSLPRLPQTMQSMVDLGRLFAFYHYPPPFSPPRRECSGDHPSQNNGPALSECHCLTEGPLLSG